MSVESRSRSNSTPNPSTSSISLSSVQDGHHVSILHHHPHLPHTHHPTLPHTTTSPPPSNGTGPPSTPPSPPSRRGSWLSSISSKFSSSTENIPPTTGVSPTSPPAEPPKSQPPGFLISTLRKFSSPSTRRGAQYAKCERMVLNRDAARERCTITGLDSGKLRKVAFSVDVEVAPIEQDLEAKRIEKKRRKEAKAEKEKEEKEKEEKEGGGEVEVTPSEPVAPKKEMTKEEKRERKERKKERRALEKMAPLLDEEIPLDSVATGPDGAVKVHAPAALVRKVHARPTTDPAQIYKQCCQLRETQQLPKVTEQLALSPGATILQTLDLSGHQFLLPDAVALSDFLALVPVKNLLMESCNLTDEMVRVVLCGLAIVKPHLPPSTDIPEKPCPTFSGRHGKTRGVIERLSFKNNPKIGRDGWRYISLFIHMSHTLKAIDLSLITLPCPPSVHAPSHSGHPGHVKGTKRDRTIPANDTTALFSRALGERLIGVGLDELVLGGCSLSSEQLSCILTGLVKGGTKRLGLGNNKITVDGMALIAQWIRGDGGCEALDLSGNSIHDHIDMISASLTPESPLLALSLSGCNLSAASLVTLLPALAGLKQFRLLDLSNNPILFGSQPDALPLLRRWLPRLAGLRKLQLANTDMSTDHAIALSEVLPEIPMLAHLDISGNAALDEEEGVAVWTALLAAVKVSKTIVRIDADNFGAETEGVVRALARRVLAYCLRNMEAGACEDWTVDLDLTGGVEVEDDDDDDEDLVGKDGREEENYVVGGTGVVKALGVCLGNRRTSGSGRYIKLQRVDSAEIDGSFGTEEDERAGEMARMLLARARRIKERIQPALKRGNYVQVDEMQHRRLLFLDETLYRVISRFESEYPECRLPTPPPSPSKTIPSPHLDLQDNPTYALNTIARHGSEVSLASKKIGDEEGQMHRFGHYIRKEILRPQTPDHLHGITGDETEGAHVRRIRKVVEGMGGEEIRRKVVEGGGVEKMLEKMGGEGGVHVFGGEIGGLTKEEVGCLDSKWEGR